MTGLLMKDLMMLKCQKQFFFVMGVVGLMFLVMYDNPTLVFGYLTIMFSFIPLTTLAYDDADNGSAYLFTLPVSRKGYLVEKYLFSAGFTLAAALLTLAVVIVACLVKNYAVQPEELGVMVMTCITVSVIFSAVSMPVQLKFGSERSRVAAALTFGGLFGICYGGAWLMSRAGISLGELEDALSMLEWPAAAGLGILLWVVVYGVSFGISLKILKGKDF